MGISHRALCVGVGIAGLAAATVPAIASHGKAGLWNVAITNSMMGAAMPDMSKLPPEAQAAMRAHGVSMNGHTMTVEHCMTQEEVNADHPSMRSEKECKLNNVKAAGNAFSADMVCSGEMKGTGHTEFVFDSPEHYTGKIAMSGTADGHPINNTTSLEGHWIGADCKGVTH